MSDDAGIEDSIDPGDGRQPADNSGETATRSGSRVSRRAFLKAAVVGGAAVGLASLGYWGTEAGSHPPGSAPATPKPSSPAGMRGYRSRPDLSTPFISATESGAGAAYGGIFLTPAAGPGPIIVDNFGSPIWIHSTPGKRALNLRVGTYKGASVLTWWEGAIVSGTGVGEYVLMDQAYNEVARVRAANGLQGDLHEFITTAEGTALFTAYEQRSMPGEASIPSSEASPGPDKLLDSIVQEVDIASGKVLFEWHASDHVSLSESYVGQTAGQPFDYFHINSIDVDTDGNLLISARHTWAVYKIDRRSGEVIWRLGGRLSDFSMGPTSRFAWQHDARRRPDGSISLFDDGSNGGKPPTEDHSRGLILDVDEVAHTATVRGAYSHPGGILATSQGSMQTLSNGNVLVGWGDQPYFTEFAADGSIVLDARLPDGSFSYRALRFAWHGTPADRPAIAIDGGDTPDTTVYASWNGATDVAVWVVLGGDSQEALAALGSQPSSGFETAISVPDRPRLVAVRAVDRSGKVLSQSLPINA
jgi:hypothetical protein